MSIAITKYDGPPMPYNELNAPMTFALLSPEYKELHPPVMCKDYLGDAFWSEKTKKDVDVYGFKWTPGQLSLKRETYAISLNFDKKKDADRIANISSLINKWDQALGFEKTKILETSKSKTFVMVVDRRWMTQPMRVSLLTLLVRIGVAYEKPDQHPADFLKEVGTGELEIVADKDSDMARTVAEYCRKIFDSGKFPKQTYAQYDSYYGVHNGSGICAMARDGEEYYHDEFEDDF